MAAEKASVRVTIYGQSFNILAADDPRSVQDLARELDELMSSIASKSGIADASRVAILAAFHLADQLRSARGELEGVREQLHERSRRMAALLDSLG